MRSQETRLKVRQRVAKFRDTHKPITVDLETLAKLTEMKPFVAELLGQKTCSLPDVVTHSVGVTWNAFKEERLTRLVTDEGALPETPRSKRKAIPKPTAALTQPVTLGSIHAAASVPEQPLSAAVKVPVPLPDIETDSTEASPIPSKVYPTRSNPLVHDGNRIWVEAPETVFVRFAGPDPRREALKNMGFWRPNESYEWRLRVESWEVGPLLEEVLGAIKTQAPNPS